MAIMVKTMYPTKDLLQVSIFYMNLKIVFYISNWEMFAAQVAMTPTLTHFCIFLSWELFKWDDLSLK